MIRLRRSAGWRGGKRSGDVRSLVIVLLFLCGFCSKTGGDVSIESTIVVTSDVTVAMTEEWITSKIPTTMVAAISSQEGVLLPTTPLDQVPQLTSQPISPVSEILKSEVVTATDVFTEAYTSFASEDPQRTIDANTSPKLEPSSLISRSDQIWSTLLSTIIDVSDASSQTDLPESTIQILPSRTKTVVPSTLYLSLPDSLNPTSIDIPATEALSEDHSATPSLLGETVIVTSEFLVSSEWPEYSERDLSRNPTVLQSMSTVEDVSLQSSLAIQSEITPLDTEMLSSTMYISETSDLLVSHVDTTLLTSINNSKTVEDISTNIFETTTILSDMVYTPWISSSYLVPSSQPLSSPVSRSTVMFPSVSYGTISNAFPRTDDVTTEIFSTVYSELTPPLTPSSELVGSERSTIIDDIIPTPSESTGNRVKRSISQVMSSGGMESDVVVSWLTSEVVETVISSEKLMTSDILGFSSGSSDFRISTLFSDGSIQSEFETLSLYGTQTLESTPSFQTITPQLASEFISTFEGSFGVSPASDSMIYSSVLELITSEITPSVSEMFSTAMDISETSDLLPSDVDTKLPSSIWISRTVEDMTTNMFETLTTTIMSDMVYTPSISPSYLVPSNQPVSSPVSRSTVLFPSVSHGTFSTAFPRTDDVTTEIFSTVYSELTPSMTPSSDLVGSERSTIFDDIIPTPLESTGNRVKRSVSQMMSELETLYLYETLTLESTPSFQTVTPHPASNFQSTIEGMASESMVYSSI
ncbi:mucin-5B-like [Lytechinus variegatus]|uniref:mucin-5B-like n=1 Tax=Lytechinus variegatus TaxID=7654 RepID=UPI001BB0EC7B|nr:mucin-5B-like [Lytechinus variegatus]